MKKLLLATAMSVACLSSAHATDYRFFCTNQSDPAINPDRDGVFVAITSGTSQSFDVVHTISKHLYNRLDQYKVTSITHPATNSYFWEGFMLNDPRVIMTGHLWENDGVWMYTENQRYTDGRPPKMATPPVVCRSTADLRQAVRTDDPPSSAHVTDYRFFCTNQSDPAVNPDQDGVFVAIEYGTDQSFDVVHTIRKQHYNRQDQYRMTSISHPAANSYLWEGSMLNDPRVIMTGHLWENDGVWMYTENQTFTDGRPQKVATPPVVCRNTVDLRQAVERSERPARQYADRNQQPTQPTVERDEAPAVSPESQQSSPRPRTESPPPRYSQASLPNCNDPDVLQVVKKLTSAHIVGSVNTSFVDMMTADQTQGMGINNNNGSKYCRAYFSCDMNVAKEAEKGVLGQHPLQAACYKFNQAADSGNPVWVQFELKPDGSGGWITTLLGSN